MRQLINQHSFVLFGLALLGAVWFLVPRRLRRFRWLGISLVVVLLVAAALALRTGAGVASDTELDRVLTQGKPVALEFYSNF